MVDLTDKITGIDHLAFITNDMVKTVRFYRDVFCMLVIAGFVHFCYRNFFFLE